MKTNIHKTAQLGELVAAAFDKAALYSADPREVSHLATQAVMNMLRRAGRTSTPPSPLTTRIFATQPHFTEPRSSHE